MTRNIEWLRQTVRDIPDFPEPGIAFKDITPLLANVDAFRFATECLADPFTGVAIDKVAGIEARGFIVGTPVACRLGAGFIPVRKAGKLPAATVGCDYELEYGTARLEMHLDAVQPGERVLVVDDVLATGGSASCCARLLRGQGAEIVGFAFLIELAQLGGRDRLAASMPEPSTANLVSALVYD